MPKYFKIPESKIIFITLRAYTRAGVACIHGISEDGVKEVRAKMCDIIPAQLAA